LRAIRKKNGFPKEAAAKPEAGWRLPQA